MHIATWFSWVSWTTVAFSLLLLPFLPCSGHPTISHDTLLIVGKYPVNYTQHDPVAHPNFPETGKSPISHSSGSGQIDEGYVAVVFFIVFWVFYYTI